MLPFTRDELRAAVLDGRVTERAHPTLPLFIYNYSPEVQFTNYWDEVTLNCRGLILDEDFNIVARPWKKFFNMGQRDNEIHSLAPVEVTDKLDGSLGILYPAGNSWAIATRGSFDSKQARHATQVLLDKYRQDFGNFDRTKDFTFLFEIIYPINRIVVNYGDMDDLVILGCVEKEQGYYMGPGAAAGMLNWNGPQAEVFPFSTFVDAISNWPEREGKEGVVVRSGNKMVKLKQAEYLELHKLVTNASPKTVWDQLKIGKTRGEIISAFPDEFHDYIGNMIDPLVEKYQKRLDEILFGFSNVLDSFMSRGNEFNRGGFARYIRDAPDKRYYFLMLDSRPVRDVLWLELRPKEKQ